MDGVVDGAEVIVAVNVRRPGSTYWKPLLLAAALYVAATAVLTLVAVLKTGGSFIYALDDPYIHLTISRTLARFGVWGITPEHFASVSSSPLWTLLLAAAFKLGGAAVWWPFAINVGAGLLLLWVVNRLTFESLAPARRAWLLAATVLVAPLPTLALIGMEHTLQAVFTVLLVWRLSKHLAREPLSWLATCATATALVALRYEGLFVVFVAVCWLAWRGRLTTAAALVGAASIPVLALGFYSLAHGGLLLPNSLLMKSGAARFGSLSDGVAAVAGDWINVGSIYERPSQVALTIAVIFLLAESSLTGRALAASHRTFGVLFVGTSLLHASLVKVEWFFRYDAYLMVLGVLAIGLLAPPFDRQRWRAASEGTLAVGALVALLALPLLNRAISAVATTPAASANVYQQQFQMAHFFQRFYPRDTVAINDIGAVSWLASSRILDIAGLASQDVTELWRQGTMTPQALDAVAARHDVKAVAMYVRVFARVIPPSWRRVGEWRIANRVGVSEDTVVFFARSSDQAGRLRAALDAYRAMLPAQVQYVRVPDEP